MKRDTPINRKVLNQLAANAKAERTKRFNSPGVLGRRRPTLSLTGELAEAVRPGSVGSKVSFRVQGVVRAIPQRGQKAETVVAVHKVTR